jgi:hypothetical protein
MTITDGVKNPEFLTLDPAGYLYVSEYASSSDSDVVTVYAPGSASVARTVNAGGQIGIDASGRLYATASWCVSRGCGHSIKTISVYARGASSPFRTIKDHCLENTTYRGLAFDRARDFYVVSDCGIEVFAPGLTSKLRTINQGLTNNSAALAIDTSGTVFANNFFEPYTNEPGTIVEYGAGSSSLLRTIRNGVSYAFALALSPTNDLFVANMNSHVWPPPSHAPSISVYAPGETFAYRTIKNGVVFPLRLQLDGNGNLYVMNFPNNGLLGGSITVYAPGGSSPSRTITSGIYEPTDMVVRP